MLAFGIFLEIQNRFNIDGMPDFRKVYVFDPPCTRHNQCASTPPIYCIQRVLYICYSVTAKISEPRQTSVQHEQIESIERDPLIRSKRLFGGIIQVSVAFQFAITSIGIRYKRNKYIYRVCRNDSPPSTGRYRNRIVLISTSNCS